MHVTIDPSSGFCFGVVYAIEMAEDELNKSGALYCLGDIVHNNREVERLAAKGLKIIDHNDLANLKDCKVLIRAHGEPPSTYETAIRNNIELIDASCPVVLKLQHRVRNGYEESVADNGQIIIYGKEGHAEVNGLVGQTGGKAIIVTTEEDLDRVDYSRPVYLYSQTTKSTEGFYKMKRLIEQRLREAGNDHEVGFVANDTICRQVANREPQLKHFASKHEVVVFVSGKKSSNGKILHDVCKSVNPRTYFVSGEEEIAPEWFEGVKSVGICGATSTPMWLMEKVAACIESLAPAPTA
ncbi:MAG: 4-hydroxy-3-methylbut-2-enyl diphosphate reductase [Flavobacteriales bacterium]|nr:4-hydroxy-3-methylbut-2-enyl diphosphate reductase [Flavobacteriales bacterium]